MQVRPRAKFFSYSWETEEVESFQKTGDQSRPWLKSIGCNCEGISAVLFGLWIEAVGLEVAAASSRLSDVGKNVPIDILRVRSNNGGLSSEGWSKANAVTSI